MKSSDTLPRIDTKAIFSEAWKKTEGFKGRFWQALLCIAVIILASSFVSFSINGLLTGTTSAEAMASIHPIAQILQMLFSIFLVTPLFAGLIMLAIKNMTGTAAPFTSIFHYIKYWKELWIYPVIMTILSLIKDLFLDYDSIQLIVLLITLALTVTYLMFIPLVVEKKLHAWDALETSRKTITPQWFRVLWFVIIIGLILVGSALTLGIALIWTLPWIYNAIAILYRHFYGIQTS
jgi:uncharacterized membrane protein